MNRFDIDQWIRWRNMFVVDYVDDTWYITDG